ncbi:MAG: DUF1365 domain-containing protein [Lysobacterales bacterium]
MHSAIYQGFVRHRRYRPSAHQFNYRVFQLYLDLDEIDEVVAGSRWYSRERLNLATFRRSDYLGGQGDLKDSVRQCIAKQGHDVPDGPIRMLSNWRYLGHCFNPVTFYYCFDRDGETLSTIVAEITNTPWKERHQYVLPLSECDGHQADFSFEKKFHVSPFIAMDRQYRWRFTAPTRNHVIHMDVVDGDDQEFDATMVMKRQPITRRSLNHCLVRYPLMCGKVVAAIHLQALRLWLKKVPVHDHPAQPTTSANKPS